MVFVLKDIFPIRSARTFPTPINNFHIVCIIHILSILSTTDVLDCT